jgi:putative tricarboxylic transport membrane protein
MEGLDLLFKGFMNSLTMVNLVACFVGALVGTIVGVLPGLGPTATMALMLPFTLNYGPETGLIMMAGVWFGSQYGGSTTSILVNIPGEAASVVTCIDGYQMAKKGRAGSALALVATGSFIAGTIGIIGLQFFAPVLGNAALSFGPPEYLAFMVLAFVLLSNLSGDTPLKGLQFHRD